MTIQNFINTYPQLPSEEAQLLKDAVAYWESTHPGQIVTINVTQTTTGSTYDAGPPNMVMKISSGSGGRFPVESVGGRPTFAQYDNMVGVVHELGHAILDLLGVGTNKYAANEMDEINNAVLAWAAKAANRDMAQLIRMMQGIEPGWSEAEKITMAKSSSASFENYYNNVNRNFSVITGLSGNPNITRKGYVVYGEWKTASNTTYPSYNLRRQELLGATNPPADVALLGNQFSNIYAGGAGNDLIDGGDGNDSLYGSGYFENAPNDLDDTAHLDEDGGNDIIIGGHGKDYIYGGGGNDFIWADKLNQHSDISSDELHGGDGSDVIHGSDGGNLIFGDNSDGSEDSNSTNDDDTLYGYGGNDVIVAGNGDDKLFAGSDNVVDYLYGGKGFDTYYTSNFDELWDEDGKGKIYFDNYLLSGEKTAVGSAGQVYEDGRFTYILENPNGIGDLTVAEGTNTTGFSGRYIRIVDFDASQQEYLGISFKDKKDIEIYVGDATATEGGDLVFDVGLNVPGLEADLVMDVEVFYSGTADSTDLTGTTTGQLTITAGQPSGTFTISTNDDDIPENIEDFTFAVTGVDIAGYTGNDIRSHLIMNAGTGTITDNDGGNVHITISSGSSTEGNTGDTNQLSFTITASRTLVDNESVTLDLSILDLDTDMADYGSLSDTTITLNASNQSQTVTLDIVGDEDPEGNELLKIDGTVVDSVDLQNVQVVSAYGTINDDDTGATPYDDVLILTDGNDVMDALAGNDYVEGGLGDDMLTGNEGDDILWGGEDNDLLYGDAGNDILVGDTGLDYLEGGTGDDQLYGGDGDDVLLGGDGSDYLDGGAGFDYYVTEGGDTVSDSDGSGTVFFNGGDLSGSKMLVQGSSNVYEDSSFTFTQAGGLTVTSKGTGESMSISGWSDGDLGIELIDTDQITVDVQDTLASESQQILRIPVTLSRPLVEGEKLVVDLGYYTPIYESQPTGRMIPVPASPGSPEQRKLDGYTGVWTVYPAVAPSPAYTRPEYKSIQTGEVFTRLGTLTFEAGDQEKFHVIEWADNSYVGLPETIKYQQGFNNGTIVLTPKENEDASNYGSNIDVIAGRTGTGTVKDDDTAPQRIDPLVLDLNKDGFISTTALDDSETYFDLTGDGLRERVGWVGPEDGLLTFDKNENGQIDGIDEVFGSLNESGFDELRRVADSNRDNVINIKDELFNSLQVWQDYNQDGRVQEGELHGLSEAGINSIDLNAVETNIELNGNVLTEASKYTDAESNKELVADIRLNADIQDTKVNIEDIPGFTIDESTRSLAQLAGSGLVFDSFIVYNTNPEFKALAEVFSIDPTKVQNDFDAFMNQWSGYADYVSELIEKYSLDNDFSFSELDRKAWIAERFLAKKTSTDFIEKHYETALEAGRQPSTFYRQPLSVHAQYEGIKTKAQSIFGLQSFYKDTLGLGDYDPETDKFVIVNETILNEKIKEHFGSANQNMHEKLFFARLLVGQGLSLNLDVDAILSSMDDNILKTLIGDMFAKRGIVLGSSESESIVTSDKKQDIFLAEGDDTLQSGKGHDTIFFRRGDGHDVIQDAGGLDKLVFAQDVAKSDVVYRLNRNMDLVIAISEVGKSFEELSDKVTLVNWMKAENRIESIVFGDNQTLTLNEVLKLYEASDATDNLGLSGGNDKFDALGGNDVINAGAGNDQLRGGTGDDRLDGGTGNDIYFYGQGDGQDVITDNAGYDILQFDAGVENGDLVAKFVGVDLLIGIKEDGKTFEELSDVITLKNFKNTSSRIEEVFLDGYRRVNVEQLLNTPTENDDVIELLDNDNTINLLAGNDTVIAGSGNDTITGGEGDDLLKGGKGDDTYIFNRGDGKDIIDDSSTFGFQGSRNEFAGDDTLHFGQGITQDDLVIEYFGSDLVIGVKEAGKNLDELSDVVTIKNYRDINNTIEHILLADGSVVTIDPVTNGTQGNDHLAFIDSIDGKIIEGLAGTDFIHTGSGNDSIRAGQGLDSVYAGAGNDVIEGGKESDFLAGGVGNDTYVYNRGDGDDVILDDNRPEYEDFGSRLLKLDNLMQRMEISDTEHLDGGYDTLAFGEGITLDDISHEIIGNDLILNVTGGGQVIIKNHLNSKNMIENIVLFDGTVIDLFSATPEDDNLVFGDDGVSIDALAGDDVVSTGSGDDTLTGNLGKDTLKGGAGNDTYVFSRGDGHDSIEELSGQDTLHFTGDITREQIEIRLIGKDLHIGIKEVGIAFDELQDKIIIQNHTDVEHALELISFDNDTSIELGSYDFGTAENDFFIFGNADTLVSTHGGDDTVFSGYGDDIITGGTGNDLLKGSAGNDTYVFSRGDGRDTVEDTLGSDTLQFTGGITSDDLIIKLVGRDLVIGVKDGINDFDALTDKVTIFNHTNKNNQLEQIVFDDGTTLSVTSMDFSTSGDDYFVFGSANANIDAQDGNDIIVSDKGNDILVGNLGDDILKSGSGQDTLAGSAGTDRLEGGRENDTYIFNRGDGVDTIHDYYFGYSLGGGILEFDADPLTGAVTVKVSGGAIEYLANRERDFAQITDDQREYDVLALHSNSIFVKVLDDKLVIARIANGKFETWPNAMSFQKLVADDGTVTFGNGTVTGDMNVELVDGELFITHTGETLSFTSNANAGNDTLRFGDGITQDDVLYQFSGNDLTLALKEDGKAFEALSDKVVIKDYILDTSKIENILFNDGSIFAFDGLPVATENADDLIFVEGDITIDALGGDDKVKTASGNDTISGGTGNDTLISGAGSDVLTGGSGNDTLEGGLGNDRYIYNRLDGSDSVYDLAGKDFIQFGEGIAQSDLLLTQEGTNLKILVQDGIIPVGEITDTILVQDWFKTSNNIETLLFADGSSMHASEIAAMMFTSEVDTLFSNHGAEMRGGKGDDTYVYKKDDFTVIINDQFYNEEIEINAGNDTLRFEDINSIDVTLGTKGDDLIIKIDAAHDTYTELKDYVVIRDWKNPNRGIESIVFGDGEILFIDKSTVYPPLAFDENWITSRYYIYGSENNVIKGSEFTEVIESGAGDDTISALAGDDRIIAGVGNDTIDGGAGDDTYVFNRGDGTDTITDNAGVDAIKFGLGISRDELVTEQNGNDLIIGIKQDGVLTIDLNDKVILKEWFNEESITYRIELMVLEVEGTIAIADFIITPTEFNDVLEYGDENNTIDALGGDDIISVGGGNDILVGNVGNDTLYGEEGDDVISGDAGIDTLYGGDGDDTYRFGRGDGHDTIIEDNFTNWSQTGKDILSFKDGITADDLILVQEGDNLVIGLKEDGKSFAELSDKVTIKQWALYDDINSRDSSRAYYAVETFSFADGSSWTMAEIIANIGSGASETIIGFNQNDTLEGQEGDDLLLGHLGDDTYVFNRGDGKDVIYDYGRKGNDYSYYDAGVDTLKFGVGITESDLIILRNEDNVEIYVKDGDKALEDLTDKIVIKDWFNVNNRVENMILSDGTAIDYLQYLYLDPTDGNDRLVYGRENDVVDALAGDDVVIDLGGDNVIDGNSGNDTIETGSGIDVLIGAEGDDILSAGSGDDILDGGVGSDTYIFNLGDGHDMISDYSIEVTDVDKIIFGTDINADALELIRTNNDLTVTIDQENSLFIQNWFLEENYRIESFEFADGSSLDADTIESRTLYYGDENANEMFVGKNAEKVFALAGDDTIYGNIGNDVITAGEGNDTIYGHVGNDTLYGEIGDDIYVYNRGDGQDTLIDTEGSEILKFGTGITQADVIIKTEGNNLVVALRDGVISFADLSDKVTIIDWYSAGNRVETFAFEDDVTATMNVTAIVSAIGEDADDTIDGTELNDVLNGESGNNTMNAKSGDDTVYANAGNDTVYGGYGNDTLIGGTGNDTLEGGYGNDTYIFNIGDGQDIIYDEGSNVDYYGGTGTLQDSIVFGDGITKESLIVQVEGENLIIGVKETGVAFANLENKITIENYFLAQNKIETFTFADGTSLAEDEILGFQDTIAGQVIYGGYGSATLTGGAGDDTIYGGEGAEIIIGGLGNDRLYGSYGNDTYIFNRGDGHDVIFDDQTYYTGTSSDTLSFGEGITINDLLIDQDGVNIHIGLKEGDKVFSELKDVITIENIFNERYMIENFSFSGDRTYTAEEMYQFFVPTTIYDEYESASTLVGTVGQDTIYGYGGNDTFIGGLGNDTFYGGYQNDTYVFNVGDGQDVIQDQGSYTDEGPNYHDIIEFGDTVSSIRDIEVRLDGDDLVIAIQPGEDPFATLKDKLTIKYGRYTNHTVETIRLADGSTYNIADYFGLILIEGSYATPIVLDLNGNGITSISLEDSNAYFDYDGDGNREHTAWAEKDDAILVADVNGDGIINDGSEHFGDFTRLPDGSLAKDGYEALAQYDTNGDRILNSKDEAFGNLLLWKDANQNGKSEEGELTNIQLSDVTAIHLDRENGISFEQYVENANLVLNETNYTTLSGSGTIRDIGFAIDIFDTITNNDTLSTEYYGSSLSGGEGNDTYLFSLGDGDISIQDNGNGEDRLVFKEGITKDQLLVKWDRSSDSLIVGIRENDDDISSITEVFNRITITNFFDETGSIESFEFEDGTFLNKNELYDILLETKETRSLTARTLEENSQLLGGNYNDLLYGGEGEDDLQGLSGNDFLRGLRGDDKLVGGEGNDVLEGGEGDDSLYGDNGDDVYLFNKGNGRDYILDTFGNDTLVFGEGIKEEDLIFTDDGLDLIIHFAYDIGAQSRDSIVLANYHLNGFGIEWAEFDDGSKLTMSTVINNTPEVIPAEESVMLQDIREQSGQIEASDVDGDTLSYIITTQAAHGELSVDINGVWTYNVDELYMGTDSAIITIDDGNGGRVTKTLNFDTRVSAPVISNTTASLLEDESATGIFNVTNPIGGTLNYEIITAAANGTFSVDSTGSWSYAPEINYHGSDTVNVKVSNEYGLSTTVTFSLDIASVNDTPTLQIETEAINLLNTRDVSGVIEASDVDGDILNYTVATQAMHGLVSVDDQGNWHYKADESYNGADTAVITVDDGNGGSVMKTLNFMIEGYIYEGNDLVIDDTTGDMLVMNDVSKDELAFTRSGNNLLVNVKNESTVTLVNFYTNMNAGVETLQTADGALSLSRDQSVTAETGFFGFTSSADGISDVKNLINGSNNYGDRLSGANLDDILFGYDGNDDIEGLGGNDLLVGGNGNDTLYGNTGDDTLYGDSGNDNLYGNAGNDVLVGGIGSDRLEGGNDDDLLSGGVDDDTLLGGSGNDVLEGGTGNDTLKGATGSDTYIYNIGDGQDLIDDYSTNMTEIDRIAFGANITVDDVTFVRQSYNLFVNLDADNFIKIKGFFNDDNRNAIEEVAFEDGTTLNKTEIISATIVEGTQSSNNLYGLAKLDDTIYGYGGNDMLMGYEGNDTLYGGSGDDRLYGDEGEDTLIGGIGNDKLEGYYGNDTYLFSKGDGIDTIEEWSTYGVEETDVIKFTGEVTKEDLSFYMDWDDLIVQYSDTDSITVKYQDSNRSKIERIELADGSYLTNSDIDIIVQNINAYATDNGIFNMTNTMIQGTEEMMNIFTSAWQQT